MLAHTNKQNRHIGSVNQADKSANHVADCVAFGDDEAVKGALGAKGSVEVAGLSNGVCPYKSLERKTSTLAKPVRKKPGEYRFKRQRAKGKVGKGVKVHVDAPFSAHVPRRPLGSCQVEQTWQTSPART